MVAYAVAGILVSHVATAQSNASEFWRGDHRAARAHYLHAGALRLPDVRVKAATNIEAQRDYYAAAIREHCARRFELEAIFSKSSDTTTAPVATDSPAIAKAKSALADYRAAKECAALRGHTNESERQRAWQVAAEKGDPRARAVLDHRTFRKERLRPHPDTNDPAWRRIDDPPTELIASIQAALSTRDPAIIVSLGPFIAENFHSTHFVVDTGSARESFSAEMSSAFFAILACEFGAECRPDRTWPTLLACAQGKACDARNLEDYFVRYVFNDGDRAQLKRFKPILKRAIETGDWKAITLAKRPGKDGRFNPPGPAFSVW